MDGHGMSGRIFQTPYDRFDPRNGKPVTLVGTLRSHTGETLLRIRFEDGFTIEVWPEEVVTTHE